MKKQSILALVALISWIGTIAQTNTSTPTTVVETMYILPKRGMDDKFEAAVKAHDSKYHPEGPYVAKLRKVEYGEKAGWYVWIYGPTDYASIDKRPDKEGGHADDWKNNVDPLVDQYGQTNLWNYKPELSYGYEILDKSKYYEVWSVDLKRGEYYRFKSIAEKLRKTFDSMGNTAFLVFDNPVHTANGADVALVWSFNSYEEWDKDNGLMEAYEKIYGKNTWQQLIDEWKDILVDYSTELRSIIK